MARVLVVDDETGIRESVTLALEKVGHRTWQASDVAGAERLLQQHQFDVVVSDIYMPGEDGLSLLLSIAARRAPPRVILMTARGTIETTAMAAKIGAFDYLAKPFDLAELIERVSAAMRVVPDVTASIEAPPPSRMIGSHPSMVALYKAIARVASLPVPVLILGESGSGKELVAQSIHDLGERADGPFVPIHCGAVPDSLLENELFGSTRGAYTDARQNHRGALTRADRGTLFLDEIGDVSTAFQVKLLRFLQDGTVMPLGSEKSQRVSVRVIAATNRDLKRLVAEGRFREDLYYRLAGYEIAVPPLRERQSDIPLLVEYFRHRVAKEMHVASVPGPSRSVLDRLTGHTWPGNVRELEQVIRRTVIDSGGLTDPSVAERALRTIAPDQAEKPAAVGAAEGREQTAGGDLASLDEAERRHVTAVLKATAGNQTRAAFILGIERKTLARKLKRLGITPEKTS